jgi:hypothetical protein
MDLFYAPDVSVSSWEKINPNLAYLFLVFATIPSAEANPGLRPGTNETKGARPVIPTEKQSNRPASQEEGGQTSLAAVIDEGRLSSQAQNGAWEILAGVADTPVPVAVPAAKPGQGASRCEEIRAGLEELAARYRRRFDCRSFEGRRRARL